MSPSGSHVAASVLPAVNSTVTLAAGSGITVASWPAYVLRLIATGSTTPASQTRIERAGVAGASAALPAGSAVLLPPGSALAQLGADTGLLPAGMRLTARVRRHVGASSGGPAALLERACSRLGRATARCFKERMKERKIYARCQATGALAAATFCLGAWRTPHLHPASQPWGCGTTLTRPSALSPSAERGVGPEQR